MDFNELQKIIRVESNKIRMPFTKFSISIVVDGITHIVPSKRICLRMAVWRYQPLPQMILVLSEEFGRKEICLSGDYREEALYQPKLIMKTESSAERWYVSKNGDWLEQWKATNGETIVTVNGVDQSETFNQILERLEAKNDA